MVDAARARGPLLFHRINSPRLLEFKRVQAARGAREPILNLGMYFSNKCGVQLNLRRMDRFIATIIFEAKPG
jgi:hypothetical protein